MASALAPTRDATRLRFEQACNDCGGSNFVEDAAAGDLICQVRRKAREKMKGGKKILRRIFFNGNVLTSLALFSFPSLFPPLLTSTNNHQTKGLRPRRRGARHR
jgi:hypothetical protein